MRRLLNMLKKNENAYSMGKVVALWSVLLWSFVTIFLVLTNKTWAHYDTLTLETIGSVIIVLCDKSFQSSIFTVKKDGDKNV